MELSAPSGLPLFIASSAALMPWSAAFFSEASSVVEGQLLVTSITLGADTAPSESLTSTASSTFPFSSSPPGRETWHSASGLKSFSCVHFSVPLTLYTNL